METNEMLEKRADILRKRSEFYVSGQWSHCTGDVKVHLHDGSLMLVVPTEEGSDFYKGLTPGSTMYAFAGEKDFIEIVARNMRTGKQTLMFVSQPKIFPCFPKEVLIQ